MKLLALLVPFVLNSLLAAQAAAPAQSESYSGMYSFLRDGEFVQITIEDEGRVTGFISRFGDGESDRGTFLDQFFREGKLDGQRLTFMTKTVHGVSFEFKGSVERADGKTPNDEGYHLVKGMLVENRTDSNSKTYSKSREVVFKSFPQNMEPGQHN